VSERIRSFIAVAVPPESVGKLRAAQEQLKAASDGIKWVSPESFHITLKFLGEVERPRLSALWDAVSAVLAGSRPFTMRFRGVGAFPSPSRARVVWAGMNEGATELAELAERVEQACGQYGFERERRAFQAHLTLGRVRDPGPNPGLAAGIKGLAEVERGQSAVDRVLLMRSELTPRGAIYHELEQRKLTGEGGE
jgi:2'-5' RNA ligase